MSMEADDIAQIFEEIAQLLEAKGENPFKVRAYQNAARSLESLNKDLATLVAQKRLHEVKGLGPHLQEKVTTLVNTGRLEYYEELKKSSPAALSDFLRIPGLGVKKAALLVEKLQITDLDLLEQACAANKIADLKGFGLKSQEKIVKGLASLRRYQGYYRYAEVIQEAENLADALRQHPAVARVAIAGSLRRGNETVRNINLLASSKKPEDVVKFFTSMRGIKKVASTAAFQAKVILRDGLPCELQVVDDSQFACALHEKTGSIEHNKALQKHAAAQGKELEPQGLLERASGKRILCKTEDDLFQALGLQPIPPELREGLGEIETAAKNQIPRLVEWTDLRGAFHCHTEASDGKATLEEMAQAAQDLGLEYLGIADHSKSSYQANGLSEERLLQQIKAIHQLNSGFKGFKLFAGSEVDILKDGRLDFDDSILKQLDYVVASVHSLFQLPEEEMTKRVIRAMENPYVTMLGHATGRLLLRREPYALNLEKIIDCAAATGTWIELNANFWRLDMDWRWWHRARDKGVKCAINPDAHSTSQIGFLKFGIAVARKGWLRKEDVVNTLPLGAVEKLLCGFSSKPSHK